MPTLICIIVGLVLIVLAALNTPSARINLGWAGVAFLVVAWLVGHGLP